MTNEFSGFKIVQLSDLHSKAFGDDQQTLVKKVMKEKPDLIVFTGDLVDSKKYDEKTSLTLMEKLTDMAPVYYVTGNHEWWSGKYDSLEEKLSDIGVEVMSNTTEEIVIGNERILLTGIDDPAEENTLETEASIAEASIKEALTDIETGDFHILLSHRPELFSLYAEYQFDLVLSGHAHGGQVRIPFIGGLIAPNQGLFPAYTAGTYKINNTTMIVNRGLGNSIIPQRIFNRPEIVVVTLK